MTARLSVLLALAAAAACASPDSQADTTTTTLAPIDTVKPFQPPQGAGQDTVGRASPSPSTPARPVTKTPAVTPAAKAASDTGRRDSVIKFDMRDPRRRVPSIPDTSRDTTRLPA